MPHFGFLNEAHACVKKLLACFHGGTLWLNTPIPLTVDLISNIIGFPKAGEDPTQYIRGRDIDKWLAKQLKERFGLQRDGRAYRIDSINSQMVHIGARISASKVVCGNWPIQCNLRVVTCAQKCAEGVQMNWSLFLLNQLLEDSLVSQTWWPFSYNLLLILISLVAWMEPEDYQPMVVEEVKVCHGARYQNLW